MMHTVWTAVREKKKNVLKSGSSEFKKKMETCYLKGWARLGEMVKGMMLPLANCMHGVHQL